MSECIIVGRYCGDKQYWNDIDRDWFSTIDMATVYTSEENAQSSLNYIKNYHTGVIHVHCEPW